MATMNLAHGGNLALQLNKVFGEHREADRKWRQNIVRMEDAKAFSEMFRE